MFEHLKINKKAQVIDECKLTYLGKINVICGKNSSGKSTLLKEISSEKRELGHQFNEGEIEEIYNQVSNEDYLFDPSFNPRKQIDKRLLDKTLNFAIKTVFSKCEVWFYSQRDFLIESIEKEFTNRIQQNSTQRPQYNVLQREFDKFYTNNNKTLLIPPKREIDLRVQLDGKYDIENKGKGILKKLFHSKTQQPGCPENREYTLLSEVFRDISSEIIFDIILEENNLLKLQFTTDENEWSPAERYGLGLQDILVILFHAIFTTANILLIEEPENHLHPAIQRKLLSFLKKETDKQYFITTHSNVFLDSTLVDHVFYTKFDGIIKTIDVTSKASILDDLGYSVADNLVSDVVILVEGPTDVPIIEEFLMKMDVYTKYMIKMWPLGGDIMDKLDLTVLQQNYLLLALIDNDPKSSKVRKRFVNKCKELGIHTHKLKRYAIENYFTLDALRSVFHSQIPDAIKTIDFDKKLDVQIGINPKSNNRKIAKAMRIDDIRGTDFYDFLLEIEKQCSTKHSTL